MTQDDNTPETAVPADQLQYELDLVENFHSEFPEQAPILDHALNELKRRTGWDLPSGFKLSGEDAVKHGAPPVDEFGHLAVDYSKGGMAKLQLNMPGKITKEDFDKLTQHEQVQVSTEDSGTVVVGELPEHSKSMLNGLYGLTGAQVVRDDFADGEKDGVVIRRGLYHGQPILFVESRTRYTVGDKSMELTDVEMRNGPHAEEAVNALSKSEAKEFAELSGLDGFQAMDTILGNNIDRRNFREVAQTLREASEAANNGRSTQ